MPLKVKSGKTGKVYDMPWTLPNDPSDDDIDKFISSQENNKSIWDKANTGIVPVKEHFKPASEALYKYGEKTPSFMGKAAMYGGAGIEALGDTLEGMTSPVNLGMMALSGGAGTLAKMAPKASKMLRFADMGANVGMATNAIDQGIENRDPTQILPFALGAMGARGAASKLKTKGGVTPLPKPQIEKAPFKVELPPEFTAVGNEPVNAKPTFTETSPVDIVQQHQNENGVRTLTQAGTKKTILPQNLRGAKPRFNMGNRVYIPQFENDIDKAAYIIAQNIKSRKDQDFLKFFMDSTGMSEQSARQYGQQVRARIKANAVGAPEGDLFIPDMFTGFKRNTPLTKTEVTNAAIVKDALENKQSNIIQPVQAIKPKTRVNPDGSFDLLNPSQETIDKALKSGFNPATGELNKDGSITMVKVVNPSEITPTSPITGPSPLNLKGNRNTGPFQEGTNGGNVPPNLPPIEPVLSPEPPNGGKPKFGLLTRVGNNLKSLTAGGDVSFHLRQGRAMMFNKEWWTSLKPTWKSLTSEKNYQKIHDEIINDPQFESARKSGLSFTDLSDDLSKREEHLGSDFASKLPGMLGGYYRAGNRAYATAANKIRFDSYKSLINDIEKAGRPIDEEVSKKIADVINNATGRASLGKHEGAAPLLNSLFFSPKFVVSRFKVLTDPIKYYNADPVVRKQALKSLLAVASIQSTIAGLGYAVSGDNRYIDPRGADFTKIKGKGNNARLDTAGGMQQPIVALAKILSENERSSNSGRLNPLNSGKFGSRNSGDVVWDFLTSKEAPIASLLSELYTGKNMVGNQVGKGESLVRHVTPMILQDLYDIMKDDPTNTWMIPIGAAGGSIQVYKPKPSQRRSYLR